MECTACLLPIKPEENLKCNVCNKHFHYRCGGVTDENFRKILPMNKGKWKCVNCKTLTKTQSPRLPTPNNGPPTSIINIDSQSLIDHIDKTFNELKLELQSFKASIADQLTRMTASVELWESRANTMENTISELSSTVASLKNENDSLRTDLNKLHTDVNNMEQASRMCNLELQNLPESKNENLVHVVGALGTLIGCPVPQECIKAVHRVQHNVSSARPKNIIIQLTTRRIRDSILAAVRKRRTITIDQLTSAVYGPGVPTNAATGSLAGPTDPSYSNAAAATTPDKGKSREIFINEHLTLNKKILYKEARTVAKDKKYKYVWLQNATILVRRADGTKAIAIREYSDLDRL